MTGRTRFGFFFVLCLSAAAVGCSSNTGTPVAPIAGGHVPTATPTGPPTATPTPAPISSGNLSSLDACAFFGIGSGTPPPAVAIPGNYTIFITEGELSGSTYTQAAGNSEDETSEWIAFNVTGTPVPTPVPTPTEVPSATPVPTGTVLSYDIFTGVYTVPGYTVTPAPDESAPPSTAPTSIAISPTVGCAIFIVTADRSPISEAEDEQAINSEALGIPNLGSGSVFDESEGQTLTELASGVLTSFTMTNLTSTGGTANFTLDAGPSGTVAFGPQQVYTESRLRALKARLARIRGLVSRRR